eukprot:GHVS01032195.1.p1 GENE.GHVS01032195.1~~GHVS01032195.1.p1  ORF type:complete len:153 (-),score=19.85 GHVS01032195.1:177-635(-)
MWQEVYVVKFIVNPVLVAPMNVPVGFAVKTTDKRGCCVCEHTRRQTALYIYKYIYDRCWTIVCDNGFVLCDDEFMCVCVSVCECVNNHCVLGGGCHYVLHIFFVAHSVCHYVLRKQQRVFIMGLLTARRCGDLSLQIGPPICFLPSPRLHRF